MITSMIYTAAITLILVMDPIGNIPVFVSLLKSVDPKRRSRIIIRETGIALIILIAFLFAGNAILRSFQISTPALSIAGGIILFLIALKMIFPPELTVESVKQRGEPFIVPLAIPMLAGPSTMATVMLFASREPHLMVGWLVALLIAWFISTVILLLSNKLSRMLGETGLTALERLMGMVLTTLAVQMFLSGISEYFHIAGV